MARDPVDIPMAEKLAAEWEARHDLAARGHRGDPLGLQHYLAHTRCEETLHHTPPRPATGGARTGAPPAAARSAAKPEQPPQPPADDAGHRRHLPRWLSRDKD